MARPTLMNHRKFKRLVRALGVSPALVRGCLELLWDHCYEAGDDYLGTAEDLETIAAWPGDPNALALALVACGLPEGQGFLEPADRGDGTLTYRVHDLWHHAPDYVRKRHQREQERRKKAVPVEVDRRTAPNGAERRHAAATPDCLPGVDRTPAPAPAPAQQRKNSSSEADASEPAVLVFDCVGPDKQWGLTQSRIAGWQAAYPNLDVLAQCRKAKAWLDARPDRRKTARGMAAFLVGWFNRQTDSSRGPSLVQTTRHVVDYGGPAVPDIDESLAYIRKLEAL